MAKDEKKLIKRSFVAETIDGKQKRVTVRGKTEKEAETKLMRKKIEYENGLLAINGNSKFETWALQWLETYKKPSGISDENYKRYETNVKNHIIPNLNMAIRDIKPYHLQNLLNKYKGKSKSLVGKIKMTLSQIFKEAVENEFIIKDPTRRLKLPETSDGTHRSITADERKYILALAKTHHAGLWIKVLLYCGLRPGESMALKWEHIDFKEQTIFVTDAVESGGTTIKDTKTAAGERNIPIPSVLYLDLKEAYKNKKSEYVFTQKTSSKRMTHESMRCFWENFKRHLDLSMGASLYRNQIVEETSVVANDLTPYCLRHTYCTDLQDAGIALNIAKYLMGHKDITVTANIYTHHSEVSIKDARNKQNSLIKKQAKGHTGDTSKIHKQKAQ